MYLYIGQTKNHFKASLKQHRQKQSAWEINNHVSNDNNFEDRKVKFSDLILYILKKVIIAINKKCRYNHEQKS